jgi:hypothetical protein
VVRNIIYRSGKLVRRGRSVRGEIKSRVEGNNRSEMEGVPFQEFKRGFFFNFWAREKPD